MKLQHLAMAAALSASTTSAWASTDPQESVEGNIPENVASFIDKDKGLLAYKSVDDGKGGKTVALIVRNPKDPDPRLEETADDRIHYSCELLLLKEERGDLRLTGRSKDAVDCDNNEINRRAEYLQLNDQLGLSPRRVTFMNDNIRGGSYSYAFRFSDGKWHLSGATSFYESGYDEVDGVQMTKEEASYPKDFGFIPMEKFDSNDIIDALAKNQSLVR